MKILNREGKSGKWGVLAGLLVLAGLGTAGGASVTLKANDALGTSSFTGSTNWSNGAAPVQGNAYSTGPFVFRTPANTTSLTFAGDSLSVNAGGRFLGKTTGNSQVLTINSLILNGGNCEQANAGNDNCVLTLAGRITVIAASGLGALGASTSGSAAFETLDLTAPISGSGALQVSGSTLNAGQDTGIVRLSAANPYSGILTVSGGGIASTVHRLLQLNDLNALSNATLTLSTTADNPVSFAAGVNTGPFNLGGLAGTANQRLTDTAGGAITLRVGGNNRSSFFSGALTGAGALVKAGAGVLTLSGLNTHTGGTTVSEGTLQLGSLTGSISGRGTVVLAAPSASMPQTVTAGGNPFSGRWVLAGGWLVGATADALGTNSILVDPRYALDASAQGMHRAGAALLEPNYDVNSAGTLTLTNGGQMVLHQNCAFTAVTVEGIALDNGTHSYWELAANFPSSFPSGNAGGFLTVQPYGSLPPPPAQSPLFLTQPVSQTNFTGMAAQFTASVYGNPTPSYQWQAAAPGSSTYRNLTTGGQFAGVTSPTLTIANLTAANAGSFVLVASNASSCVTSTPALLTVLPGPAGLSNACGLSVAMAANGAYTIASATPAWTFGGSLAAAPFNLVTVEGSDNIGGYSELHFSYTASVTHSAGIRLYTNQPVVLFSDTSLAAGPNDLAFPHLTAYPANLYHLSYSGMFAPYTFSGLSPDSPWLFFDTNFNAFILSPATNFVLASDTLNGDGSISCGVQSAISQLPVGFTHGVVLTVQPGINQALGTWGNVLTGLSGKVRPANDATVELNKLGYWTDNGASYYYNYASSLGYAGTLLALRDEFAAKGFPLGYLQLDSWWYPKGTANTWQGDPNNNRGGVNQYMAEPTLFPAGLAAFQQQLGLPLFTHCRWIDPASPYRSQYAMSRNVVVDADFWTRVMSYLKNSGVVTFEQDWLNDLALPAMNLYDPPAFMNYMAAAAASNGLNMQFCMELPRHYLQSSLYTNLVTLRVSTDRFEIGKWNNFLYCSRLANAVGAWPWSDVFPSSEARNLLLSTLSAGPVGVGDALGALNTNNLAKTVRPDGVIVKPDEALAPVDQTYLNEAQGLSLPMVAATHVDHEDLRALYVFAYARTAANTNASFTPSQLGLPGSAYVYDYLNGTGAVVVAGSPWTFSTSMPGNSANGSFFVAVPIGPSGIGLLGDTNKFVTLGKKRIPTLADSGVLKASVAFAAGETNLTLAGYAPSAPYAWALNGAVRAVTYDSARHLYSVNVTPGDSSTALVALSLSPPPFLQIVQVDGGVQVSWPAESVGYILESTTSLGPASTWMPTTNPVTVAGNRRSLLVAPTGQTTFYRLKQ